MQQAVTLELRDRVAILQINRPDVRNAIDIHVAMAIRSHVEAIASDTTISALVVCGSGTKAFSAGADLATVARLNGSGKRRFIETCWRAFDDLARLPIPTIAAIHGYALGGGLELALACDLRVADADAVLGFPELTLGGVASFGAVQRLPGMVGTGRARDLLLRARRLDGREAERIGLVTLLSARGAVLEDALSLAEELSTRPREAVRYLKLALDTQGHAGAAELHGLISDLCHSDPEYQARIARFATTKTEPTK